MIALSALLLARHPWLSGMSEDHVRAVAEHAREVRLAPRQTIFAEGEAADRFWLIWEGQVALVLDLPGRGTVLIETLGPGDILGWSWLFPPYRWRFGAIGIRDTRAVEVDAAAVRSRCEGDPAFCAEIYKRVSAVTVERLQATRLRLLDLYRVPDGS